MEENNGAQMGQNMPDSNGGSKSKTAFIIGAAVLLVAIVGFAMTRGKDTPSTQDETVEGAGMVVPGNTNVSDTEVSNDAQAPVDNAMMESDVRTFTFGAKNFAYEPVEMRVFRGDKVKVILRNDQGFHDFVIDEFSVRTQQIAAPNTTEIEFIADKVGEFEYYCSVGQHRAMGMKGKLIVEEAK